MKDKMQSPNFRVHEPEIWIRSNCLSWLNCSKKKRIHCAMAWIFSNHHKMIGEFFFTFSKTFLHQDKFCKKFANLNIVSINDFTGKSKIICSKIFSEYFYKFNSCKQNKPTEFTQWKYKIESRLVIINWWNIWWQIIKMCALLVIRVNSTR